MSRRKRALVAMSGGVDSSIASAILKKEGYEVIGVTMKLWPKELCTRRRERACCSLQDIEDVKRVCDVLNIRHYVLDFEEIFRKEVIDYFTREYMAGRTPNPCIVCNEKIKFGRLLKKAEELECDFIATGHYARIERTRAYYKLRESVDKTKDQSYVLFSVPSSVIEKILFPIGNLRKDGVKSMAQELGLSVYKKPESQEICFVTERNYSSFIKEYYNVDTRKGDIVDTSWNVLGRHNGFWNFTIGQRKGLGISFRKPLYVVDLSPEKNIVVVGDYSEVRKKRFIVKDINWFYKNEGDFLEAEVKIRYKHDKQRAFLKKREDGKIEVEFAQEQEAITPGQAAVFYDGEYVLGGGWIEKVLE